MAVEIRELIIRAVAAQNDADSDEYESFADDKQERFEDQPWRSTSADDRQAIIQECVRQVLRVLQQKKER